MDWHQILPVIFPIIMALVVFAAMFSLRYRLTETEVQVRILGITVRRVKFADIGEIKKGRAVLGENWAVPFPGREMVVIKRKKGLFKYVNITPPQADDFITQVRERIASLPPESIGPGWKNP